jgi:hypothetical protein
MLLTNFLRPFVSSWSKPQQADRTSTTKQTSKPSALARAAGETCVLESLERRLNLTADLALEVSDNQVLPDFLVPGDTPVLNLLVRNNSPLAFTGAITVRVDFFSAGGIFGNGPSPVATFNFNQNITNLAPDAALAVNVNNINIAAVLGENGLDGIGPGDYEIIATIIRPQGQTWTDEFSPNNSVSVTDSVPIEVRWVFGNVDSRTNIVFRGLDIDGTAFSIGLTGGGSGEIQQGEFGQLIFANALGNAASTLTFTGPTTGVGTARTIDLNLEQLSYNVVLQDSRVTQMTLNAPTLNLTGNVSINGFEPPIGEGNVSPAIALGSLNGDLNVGNALFGNGPDLNYVVRSLAIGTLGNGQVLVDGNVDQLRITTIEGGDDSGIEINGNVGTITVGDASFTAISVDGSAGAINFGDINGISFFVEGNGTTFRAGDILGSEIGFGGRLTSFVAGDIADSAISINFDSRSFRSSMTFQANQIQDSVIDINQFVSTFAIQSWVSSNVPPALQLGNKLATNTLSARAFGTLTTRIGGTRTEPIPGDFVANIGALGGISRQTQVANVNIAGAFTGSLIVNGSVGTFTAAEVDTVDPNLPTILANGTIRSFTSPAALFTQLWGSNIGTVNATLPSESNLEVLGGVRFNPTALADGDVEDLLDSLVFRSGAVGALNLTLPAASTGVVVRATAGVSANIESARDVSGNINFANNLTTSGSNTISRLGSLTVNGSLTGNSLQFGFITYPATARLGTSTVTLPATSGSGPIAGAGIPANVFWRLGRPPIL